MAHSIADGARVNTQSVAALDDSPQQRFDARIDAGDFIEAKDWMPENYRKTLVRQISQIGRAHV